MPARPTASETHLYSEGAEFLVLGQLLIRGVHATKAYARFPGWDILATNPETGSTCRLQVKARLASDFDGGFPIKNFDAEFVVLVALNRGNRYRKDSRSLEDSIREPTYWVLPMVNVLEIAQSSPKWGESSKVYLRRLEEPDQYLAAWQLVAEHIGVRTTS